MIVFEHLEHVLRHSGVRFFCCNCLFVCFADMETGRQCFSSIAAMRHVPAATRSSFPCFAVLQKLYTLL